MPRQLTTAFSKLLATVREFSLAQRTIALIGMALLVVAIIAVSTWITKPQMRALYTDLAPADAAAIVDQLSSEGVPYELTNNGATVMVPAEQVFDQRLKIASAGITPTSESGYSLLDSMGLTSSSFQQDVTYKRALEGELAATVQAMSGIEAATVQLALPKESVFVSETADPSASVFVKASRGSGFAEEKVHAIVQFIASAVPGMKNEHVSVIDDSGEVLSAQGIAQGGVSSKETAQYESRVAGRIQSMLDRILGAGQAVVSVAAELDYDATERTSETFESNPDAQPLTERESVEEYTGSGRGSAGVLGPDNIAVPDGDEDGSGTYTNTTAERSNAVDKVTEHTLTAPGTLRKQAISVAVDQTAAANIDMGELEGMVAAAAAIDPERGDQVIVTRLAFDNSMAQQAQEALAAATAEAEADRKSRLIRDGAIAVLIVLAALITLAVVQARRRRSSQVIEPYDIGEVTFEDSTGRIDPDALLSQINMPEMLELPPAADAEAQATERKRQDVATLVDEKPAEIAEHLRNLMAVQK